jgi:hypothetical protein
MSSESNQTPAYGTVSLEEVVALLRSHGVTSDAAIVQVLQTAIDCQVKGEPPATFKTRDDASGRWHLRYNADRGLRDGSSDGGQDSYSIRFSHDGVDSRFPRGRGAGGAL